VRRAGDDRRPRSRGAGPGRRTIPNLLGEAALTTPHVAGIQGESIPLMPDVRVLKIGGQSILDRGRKAVYPLIDEIVALKDRFQILLCAGGGTRARHAYELALDLGLPTGVLAALGGFRAAAERPHPPDAARAARRHLHPPRRLEKLPLYFRLGCVRS